MSEEQRHVVFIGNPGVGKSTLLNVLMSSEADRELNEYERFVSGISIGSGLTYRLDRRELKDNGVIYMDTPGLSDMKKREEAAAAITEALKQDGKYQIIFVITLEAGRVRADDVTTINLVLQSAPEIKYYGLIINKLEHKILEKLKGDNDNIKKIIAEILQQKDSKSIPFPLLLESHSELVAEDNKVIDIPDVKEFINCLLPPFRIHSRKVENIAAENFDALKSKYEKIIEELRADQENLRDKIEKDKQDFQRQAESIQKEEPSFLKDIGEAFKAALPYIVSFIKDIAVFFMRNSEEDD